MPSAVINMPVTLTFHGFWALLHNLAAFMVLQNCAAMRLTA
jgi:hypothetical protein